MFLSMLVKFVKCETFMFMRSRVGRKHIVYLGEKKDYCVRFRYQLNL